MVQLKILTGKKAGTSWTARRFPIRVGRDPSCDLQLEEQGVWNEHFQIGLNRSAGFVIETQPDALVTANGQPLQRAVLRNGDVLQIGSLKLQFWLAEARQRGLRSSECLVWGLILGITLGQVTLAYCLPR